MTNTDLEALVQKLAEHGCKLLIEHDGYGYSAAALKEERSEQYRCSNVVIRTNTETLAEALALLAETVEKAEWIDAGLLSIGTFREGIPCSPGN